MNAATTQTFTERVDYLDGWRGLAIALVLEGHFLNLLPIESGRLGVDLFFCLSGFLMSGILFQKRQPLTKFYKRRISRIIPAFAVFVVLMHLFAYVSALDVSLLEFASTFFFLRTYIPDTPGIWKSSLPIGHLWSLNIEEHCYIFMSLIILARFLRGREGLMLIGTGVACIALGVIYIRMGVNAPHWGELGTEVAASHLLISAGYRQLHNHPQPRFPAWLPLMTLVIAVACYSTAAPWWCSRLISPFMLAFTINHLATISGWFRSLLSTQPFILLGIWSFSIYLWQQPFFTYKEIFPGKGITAFFLVFIVSFSSYRFIEQPCRNWLNRNW